MEEKFEEKLNEEVKKSKEEEYEVESIIDHKWEDGELCLLIRWKNYSSDFDTWEKFIDLQNCLEVVQTYLKKCGF